MEPNSDKLALRPAPETEAATAADPAADPLQVAYEAQVAGDKARAKRLYNRFLMQNPKSARAWTNIGVLYRVELNHARAMDAQERAYALDPNSASVCNNYANVLDDVGRNAEAIEIRRKLLRHKPDDAEQIALLVRSLRATGDIAGAIKTAEDALQIHPNAAAVQLQLGLSCLHAGDYRRGFHHYLARWETGALVAPKTRLARWRGEPIDGKRILVLPEQGFGDTINFCRFLPFLKELGAHVSMMCRPAVRRLLSTIAGADVTLAEGVDANAFDMWTSMMDIPAFYFARRNDIPPPAVLSLPEDSRTRARQITRPYTGKFKVGVAWTGSTGYDRNSMRSFPHTDLLQLARIDGVQLFSLYKGPFLDAYIDDGTATFIPDTASTDRDLADCAATIAEMDLVITADTVTAHIAGSLGVEVWDLLHWEPFWLYGSDAPETPWYASMRLLRQRKAGDWQGVFDEAARLLRLKLPNAGKAGA